MLLRIDKFSSTPIYKQIVSQLKGLIDQGVIEVNKPLPPTRKLAQQIGVNRSTVDRAYDELEALGYLNSRPGSYHIVQRRKREAAYHPERKSKILWRSAANQESETLFETFVKHSYDISVISGTDKKSMIDLSEHQVGPELFPIRDFKKCLNAVLVNHGSEALDFCSAKGNERLREYIAQRMRLHGISTSKEEILITNGSQEALSMIVQLLARSDKKIVIEVPTYFNFLPILKFLKSEFIPVPMTEEGMDLEYLERVLDKEKVSFIYTIPNFHNPTGITTSHQHREQLLNIALKKEVAILEDGFEEEMKYYGKVPLPIKSIDEHNIVIYVGTFTKTLFPGVRIGWINADKECINRLTAIKQCTDLRCGNFTQTALWYFCKEGYYDLHIKKMHRVFRKKMDLAIRTMYEYFPKGVRWSRPAGGYNIWVKMPKKLMAEQLYAYMAQFGVIVTPGCYFFPNCAESEYFRISLARTSEQEIKEGFARLGKALQMLSKKI
jgi:DNA-binding transcriptional MocR family regulator